MRLSIAAAAGELEARGHDLLEALADRIGGEAPVLGDQLRKAATALEAPAVELDAPVLRDLHRRARRIHAEETRGMLDEIAAVLNEGEPLKKSALDADGIAAILDETEDLLAKGAAHKYLARIPTGNPKRPWRYVYQYRRAQYGTASTVDLVRNREKELRVGAKFADGDGKGHWEITAAEKVPGKDRVQFTAVHDETGAKRIFDGPYDVTGHLDEAHEKAARAEGDKRREGAKKTALAAADVLHQVAAIFRAHPTPETLAPLNAQWSRLQDRARDAAWGNDDWRKAMNVSTEIPKTWNELRTEYNALKRDLRSLNPSATAPLDAPTESYWSASAALRLDFLHGMVARHYGADQLGRAWHGEKYETLPQHRKVLKLRVSDIIKALDGKPITPKNVMAVIGAELSDYHGEKVAAAKMTRFVIVGDDDWKYNAVIKKRPEAWGELAALATQRGWWFAATTEPGPEPKVSVYEGRSTLGAAASAVGAEPRPDQYAKPGGNYQAITTQDVLAHVDGTYASDPETKTIVKDWVGTHGYDPIVSGLISLPVQRPKPNKRIVVESAREEDHEKRLAEWKRDGGRSFRSVDMPLSMFTRLLDAKREAEFAKVQTEHLNDAAHLERGVSAVATKVGDPTKHIAPALTAFLAAEGVPADQVPGLVAEVTEAIRTAGSGPVRSTFGGIVSTYGATHALWKKVRPAEAELASHWLDSVRGKEPAVMAADKAGSAWREKAKRAIRDHVLAQITAEMGHKPDAAHALSKVQKITDAEAAASYTEARKPPPAAPGEPPKPVEPSRAYDLENDPERLKELLGFIDASVAPTARVEVHPGMGRAHCSYDNAVRLDKKDGPSVAWHEFGHAIEHASPGITRAANALRDKRAGQKGTPDRKLKDIHDGSGYEDHERAYEDNWWRPYVGKWYRRGGSTEVLSMGVQELMADPIEFFLTDPEHFGFTVAALTGAYGGAEKDLGGPSIAALRKRMGGTAP